LFLKRQSSYYFILWWKRWYNRISISWIILTYYRSWGRKINSWFSIMDNNIRIIILFIFWKFIISSIKNSYLFLFIRHYISSNYGRISTKNFLFTMYTKALKIFSITSSTFSHLVNIPILFFSSFTKRFSVKNKNRSILRMYWYFVDYNWRINSVFRYIVKHVKDFFSLEPSIRRYIKQLMHSNWHL